MRNLILIDGSNFYHRAKTLSPEMKLSVLNYRKLAETLTGTHMNRICYCVGEVQHVPGDAKSLKLFRGQQRHFHNLHSQNIILHRGFMLKQQGVYIEKGVDIRIAVEIVAGALKDAYDHCFLISSDSDLLPAVLEAKNAGKKITYIAFEKSLTRQALRANCNKTIFITREMLSRCCPPF